MEAARSLLEALQEVREPLTFWAFLSVVALVALYVFLRSDRFNDIWSATLGSRLSAGQVFRLARYFLVGVFILLVLTVIAAATAPLILKKLHVESTKNETLAMSIEESAATREMFVDALRIFREERNYMKAREAFRSLRQEVTTEDSRDVVEGLITASFYGEGSHRKGLFYICELYRVRPRESIRYRFDIHAHIRAIALEEGFDVAEAVAVEFATRCERRDFSPVWAGIPLAKMEYLKKGRTVFEEYFRISPYEAEYLKDIVRYYPIDAFLDHAYYFLYDFNEVIGTGSIIEDVAILAALQQDDRRVLQPYYLQTDKPVLSLQRRISLLKLYIEKFPKSDRYEAMRKELISTLFASGLLSEGLETAFEDKRGVAQHLQDIMAGFGPAVERFGLDETLRIARQYDFDAILLSHHHEASQHVDSGEHGDADWPLVSEEHWIMDERFDDIWGFVRTSKLRNVLNSFANADLMHTIGPKIGTLWERYLDEGAFEPLLSGDIPGALGVYRSQRDVMAEFDLPVPEGLAARIEDLEGVVGADMQDDPRIRLVAAILLRDFGAKSLAIERFQSIADGAGDPVVAQKALYLAGAALRRMRRYGSAKDMFERLWRQFPDGHLADDALAELGWYYLMVERERETAHEYFRQVVRLYPEGNAADNALNWLGWSNLGVSRYPEALASYAELVASYAGSRLSKRAKHTMEILKKVLETRTTVVRLKGVSLRENYVWRVRGDHLPLRFGDAIVGVNDYDVVDGGTLSGALGSVTGN